MKEYHKIQTLFKRDETTKKLFLGKFTDETIEFCKDLNWQFTEKVDGTNIRVNWDGHKVTFGGRTENAQIPAHLINRLNELFSGEANAQLFEQKFGETEVTFYGEGYGPKIQTGGSYRDSVDFILFDVEIGNVFLKRQDVENIAKYFQIDVVPILLEGTIDDGLDYVLTHKDSQIATNGAILEGLVGRPIVELRDRMGRRLIVKIKRHDFD